MKIEKSTKIRKRFIVALVVAVYIAGGILLYDEGANQALNDVADLCQEHSSFQLDETVYACMEIPASIGKGTQS